MVIRCAHMHTTEHLNLYRRLFKFYMDSNVAWDIINVWCKDVTSNSSSNSSKGFTHYLNDYYIKI